MSSSNESETRLEAIKHIIATVFSAFHPGGTLHTDQ